MVLAIIFFRVIFWGDHFWFLEIYPSTILLLCLTCKKRTESCGSKYLKRTKLATLWAYPLNANGAEPAQNWSFVLGWWTLNRVRNKKVACKALITKKWALNFIQTNVWNPYGGSLYNIKPVRRIHMRNCPNNEKPINTGSSNFIRNQNPSCILYENPWSSPSNC